MPGMTAHDTISSSWNSIFIQRVWRKAFGEKSRVSRFGSFRERERYGLVNRANYAYGMLRAADVARFFGIKSIAVCEFGVATGNGLMNMLDLADLIKHESGVDFRIVGFDTGSGLLPPVDHRDHPELWSAGDFSMGDAAALGARIGGRAELIIGDIKDNIDAFRNSLTPDCPLGFVSIDVDVYTASASSLRVMQGRYDQYLPAVGYYFDDVASYFSNEACGELLAIREHNAGQPLRPLGIDRSLMNRRVLQLAPWHDSMYVCHILDHPDRNVPRKRAAKDLQEHWQFMGPLS
jgi:hypothetical protein